MSEQAANPVRKPPSSVGTWVDHHLYSFVSSLGRISRRPWATLLTIGVMAVALALPLGLWLVLDNVARLGGDVQASRQVDVFLDTDVDLVAANTLATTLRERADVAAVEVRTPADGLAQLREQAGLGDSLEVLGGENPLPVLLVVTPAGDELALAESLRALPEADLVQHDALWRQRLEGWLGLGRRVALVLAALLGLGALLVVGNTVRMDIQSRREEIGVLQHLGATDGFIRRPFLYLGAWYGLAAGGAALLLLAGAGIALREPLANLSSSYGSGFALQGFTLPALLAILAGAAVLGWLGAGAVAGHYLRQTRPTDT
ncbi:MAG: permease-like cell division protein FtsX [Pseudoxanthomonas suwonensis]|nr:permease-like cell division protein FtsX [Pseudoxanthomonas suwonensis]